MYRHASTKAKKKNKKMLHKHTFRFRIPDFLIDENV